MHGRQPDDRRWYRGGKGRGYTAHEEAAEEYWDDGGDYEESVYYGGGDDWGDVLDDGTSFYEDDDFDAGAGYYEDDEPEDPVPFDLSDYDEAFAAYTDARRRFNELKLARGYLPIDRCSIRPKCWQPHPWLGISKLSTDAHGERQEGRFWKR